MSACTPIIYPVKEPIDSSIPCKEIQSRLREVELKAARGALLHYFRDSMEEAEKEAIIERIVAIQVELTGRPAFPQPFCHIP